MWDSGEWWMLLAAQSMAVGTVMVRWCANTPTVMATGWHMAIGGVPLLAYSIATEPAVYAGLPNLDAGDVGGLGHASLFGSAVAYGAFFYFASKEPHEAQLAHVSHDVRRALRVFALGRDPDEVQLAGALVTVVGIYLVNTRASAEEAPAGEAEAASLGGQKRANRERRGREEANAALAAPSSLVERVSMLSHDAA